MCGIGRVALPKVLKWSISPPGCPRLVERPFQMSGSGKSPSRMSAIRREANLDVRECSGGPPECSGVVCRPSWMSGSGRESLPNVRDRSGGPPGCPGVVGRPYPKSANGQETLRMSVIGQ